ncbi:MAG: AAA family ATPase, partial [Pseudomonadota bacterium]
PQSIHLDLLDDGIYNKLQTHPEDLYRFIPKDNTEHIVIDEVQKVPALLNSVHKLIEEKKFKFILTGSSSRKLKKEGVNLLAGRALICHMFPLTVRELGADFNLLRALDFGTLPSLLTEESPSKYLESYVRAYIKEEVNSERLVRSLANFSRFLEAATFSHARELVVSNVAKECAVERKVVEDYFSILEDLLLSFRLPVFSKRAKRELLTKERFFFFDSGIFHTLRPKGPLDTPEEIRGCSLEGLVCNEIRALNSYFSWGLELFHWRTKKKEEVDLILYGHKSFVAIEIKSSEKVRNDFLEGLKIFKKDYPTAQAILLYGGEKEYYLDDIQVVPVVSFLLKPEKYIFKV